MQNTETVVKHSHTESPVQERVAYNIAMVRETQLKRGDEPCYMTEKRLLCKNRQCEWRQECRKLVAVWKR